MKKILFLLLLFPVCLFSTQDFSKLSLPKHISVFTLDNGLKVILKREASIPLVGVSLFYRVGFRNEVKGNSGLTHLLEHMMFQATKNYPKGQINRQFELIGARNNAYTSYEKTVYHEILPPAGLTEALKIEADRMQNALLIPSEYEREKQVVLSEITKHEKTPSVQLERKLFPAVFGDHPFSFLYGYLEDVSRSTRDYTYQELYKKYYVPNNAVLIVVGSFQEEKVKEQIKRIFGKIPSSPSLPPYRANPMPFQRGLEVKVKGTGSENFGEILFKLPATDLKDPDFVALSFIQMAEVIGNFSYFSTIDGGVGFINFHGEPAYPADVLSEDYLREHLEDFKTKLFARELMDYDSVSSLINTLTYLESSIGVEHYRDLLKDFMRLKSEDLIRVVQKYLCSSNASVGYFEATKYDPHLRSGGGDFTDRFSAAVEDPEKYIAEDLKKLEELNQKVFNSNEKILKNYLGHLYRTRLSNGLTLIYKPTRLNEKLSLYLGVQSLRASQKKAKQAEFTFHFVMKGGPQIILENELKKHGASFGARFSPNYAQANVDLLKKDVEKGLKFFGLMLKNRRFIPVLLEDKKYRAIRSDELREKSQSPDFHALKENLKQIYAKEGSGLDIWAKPQDYLQLKIKDIEDFYVSFYRPENTVLVVAGDLDWETLKKRVQESLGGEWQKEKAVLKKRQPVFNVPSETVQKIQHVNTLQAVVMMSAPTVDYEDISNYTGMLLASQIFGGGGLSSRLMREIRDRKGLTYGVYFYPHPEGKRTFLQLKMQVNPKNIEKAKALFFKELERYHKEGPSLGELLLYQNSLINQVLFRYENGSQIADSLLYYSMRRQDPFYDLNYIRLLEGFSVEDLKGIIQKTFPRRFFISTAQP